MSISTLNRLMMSAAIGVALAGVSPLGFARTDQGVQDQDASHRHDARSDKEREADRQARQDERQGQRQDEPRPVEPRPAEPRQFEPRQEQPRQDMPRPREEDRQQRDFQQQRDVDRQQREVDRQQREQLVEQRDRNRQDQAQAQNDRRETYKEQRDQRETLQQDRMQDRQAVQQNRIEDRQAAQHDRIENRQGRIDERQQIVRDSKNREVRILNRGDRPVLEQHQQDQAVRFNRDQLQVKVRYQQAQFQLQEQNRTQQYRSYQDYCRRHDQLYWRYWNHRNNYWNLSWFFAPAAYSVYYDGGWYGMNHYQSDLIRQALNYGYEEGFHAGRADRYDHWRFDYRSNYIYRDADYGYYGYYVDEDMYSYYFREGFRRGYEDGYYSRYRYGRYYNGGYSLRGDVMNSVFRIEVIGHF